MAMEIRYSGSPVRLGGPRRPAWPWAMGAGAGVVVVVGLLIWFKSTPPPSSPERGESTTQCKIEADCKARHLCLEGGCAPLLSSQDPIVWHADLKGQKAAGPTWKPPFEPGEALPAATSCPAPQGEIVAAEPGRVRHLFESTVYEIRQDAILIHKYTKAMGSIWVDNIDFSFPGRLKIDPVDVCAGPSVAHVAVFQGASESVPSRVLCLLRQAVPSDTMTSAAISVRFAPPNASADGMRTLVIPLVPSVAAGKQVTVIALPLGAHIEALQGPAPKAQRLLRGFFAYYFHHGAASQIAITYRLNQPTRGELDIPTVRP
ncbi:MAG: hypothetical protein MUC50_00030 [Myxococcota bacterium]|nr:hypothetical protein [Myxococcota bacterium]